jgi:sporulation protein YlmC with PRC-barrel domain
MRLSQIALVAVIAVATPAIAQQRRDQDPGVSAGSTRQSQDYYAQKGDEMRASKLVGAPVRNDADERIGEVNEVILTKDGKVAAVIIGVGGFLGIGERDVGMSFNALRIEPDNSATASAGSVVVRVKATKDTLRDAPAWTWPGRR